ncbi:Fur family transcriptional regulator [Limisalsivibrio acetivorans]|uniref:Fur family transcriptional regulator n=1 Tax=Limisalsivibrio acetivorans TaxID=1304888 RepID=UPI0003B32905|nr:Fur family transcriptional regulator [Limisalsivibrio acetivorans]
MKLSDKSDISMQESVKRLEKECSRAGLKLTHQRIEIYRALLASDEHPTVEMLHKRFKETMPRISFDTVYRTLVTFSEAGIARRVYTSDSQARYEVESVRHHHLVCSKCGSITDFIPAEDPETPAGVEKWGDASRVCLVVEGVCHDCSAG